MEAPSFHTAWVESGPHVLLAKKLEMRTSKRFRLHIVWQRTSDGLCERVEVFDPTLK
jgi:hypothetical protein